MCALRLALVMAVLVIAGLARSFAADAPAVAALSQDQPNCAASPVPVDDDFVVAWIRRGQTLANILFEPPNAGSIIRVDVTPGARPVTLFLVGDAVIWDFAGDVDRVSRVIAMRGLTAVRGLAAARVDFPPLADCRLPFVRGHYGGDTREERFAAVTAIFGRAPDHEIEEGVADQLTLPAATVSVRDEDGDALRSLPPAERELLRKYPGGFRELDPVTLLTPATIRVPRTPPAEAGVLRLVQRGDIRAPTPPEVTAFVDGASRPYRSRLSPDFRLTIHFDYAVTRPVELPEGTGKSFLFLPGVPAPAVDVSTSRACIASMDGFRINNEFCFHEHDAISDFRTVAAADDHGACRLLAVPAGASIEAVSAHGPQRGSDEAREQAPAPISLRVSRPGDIVLILNTNDATTWRISSGPDTRIVGVILSGYEASRVEGVAPGTPLLALAWRDKPALPKLDPACAPFTDYVGLAYKGGPGALALDRQVRALTGRGIDGLRGAHTLKEVAIP